jgi:hypothetical protein
MDNEEKEQRQEIDSGTVRCELKYKKVQSTRGTQ